jgi:hypothetical protein
VASGKLKIKITMGSHRDKGVHKIVVRKQRSFLRRGIKKSKKNRTKKRDFVGIRRGRVDVEEYSKLFITRGSNHTKN